MLLITKTYTPKHLVIWLVGLLFKCSFVLSKHFGTTVTTSSTFRNHKFIIIVYSIIITKLLACR